ncbi:unnamed protein product, partial [Rotaria magnacalcarata]
QESTSATAERQEESNDADDSEPSKKKFKDDTEVETSATKTLYPSQPRLPKKRKVCVSFGYCGAGY